MNGDTISRSSVLRKLDSFHPDYTFNLASFKNLIKAEPTVEKKGKWEGYNGDNPDWQRTDGSPVFLVCSECGATVVNNFAAKWNYCCSCGADMRGEQDG